MRHVVSQAYAQLVYDLARDIGEKKPQAYYSLWPESRRTPPKPFVELAPEVYKLLDTWPVIRATGKDRWLPIGKVLHLPTDWEGLSEPLAAQGLALPDPVVKPSIIAGFTKVEVELNTLTPPKLRQLLRQQTPLAVRPKDSPLPCLRKRAWLEILLKYCLSDEPRDLSNIPLALMSDGLLRTFGHTQQVPMYIAKAEERAIFHGQPGWFVSESFALVTGLSATRRTGAMWMTAEEVLKRLRILLPKSQTHAVQPELSPSQFLNAGWLKSVYDYFVAAITDEFEPEEDEFQTVPLVPDQDGQLHCPAFASTPLLIQDFGSESLHKALRAFGISIATAAQPLEESIRAFDNACGFVFVPKVTGPQLAYTLRIRPAESFPPYSRDTYGAILDFLSRPNWVGGDGQYNAAQKKALRELPIYPTLDGPCVTLDSGAFLPADYDPPPTGESIAILSADRNPAWQKLYRFLDVPTLNRYTFISDYLLPRYATMTAKQQLVALAWLRDHVQHAESEMEAEELDPSDLTNEVKAANLICCEGGKMLPARDVYHPKSPLVRELFGDSAVFPDMKFYAHGAERWLAFFRDLGMEEKPRARDVVAYVDRLTEGVEGTGPVSIRRAIMKVYDFVESHWGELREQMAEEFGSETVAEAA